MNWSPGRASADGDDQVRPRSNDWLTMTSEFVVALYGLVGAGSVLFRMSDHTTARCAALVRSAAMLPAAQVRNTLSWYVCRPKAIGKSVMPSMVVATFTGAPSAVPVVGSTSTTS